MMTLTKTKYGHPLDIESLIVGDSKPERFTFGGYARYVAKQVPPLVWAAIIGAIGAGVYIGFTHT